MPVVVGELEVVAAPPPGEPASSAASPPPGLRAADVVRIQAREDQRRARRAAD
ncbi:hypothetical protein [Nocardioides gilvus]|uniref:hypothetical protein n=1 Tax=Nocardioides gilvus TaxID=1735589 RepID=UPI0013A57983|nr:hypothetical protein [Nocardioides gilvus]